MACLARFRADMEPRLTRLPVPTEPPNANLYLLVHKDNRDTPRIRVVLTHIAECIYELGPILQPMDVEEPGAWVVAG